MKKAKLFEDAIGLFMDYRARAHVTEANESITETDIKKSDYELNERLSAMSKETSPDFINEGLNEIKQLLKQESDFFKNLSDITDRKLRL